MPIRPENRSRYPKDWKNINHRIRFDRGKGRCECTGECGLQHIEGLCSAEHGKPHPMTGSIVILTCAHLPGREIEQVTDDDLKGMCQQCHNLMDMTMRRAGIQERVRALKARADFFDENK